MPERLIRVGSTVEYRQIDWGRSRAKVISGTVVEIIEGRVLMNVDTGERQPAVAFVIRDARGRLHETSAMAEAETGVFLDGEPLPVRPPESSVQNSAVSQPKEVSPCSD